MEDMRGYTLELRSGTRMRSEARIKTKDNAQFPKRFIFPWRRTSPTPPLPGSWVCQVGMGQFKCSKAAPPASQLGISVNGFHSRYPGQKP